MVLISKRLNMIAEMVPAGSKLADIGSDHALLPVFLCQQGKVRSAVAGELNPGPYAAALKQVSDAGQKDRIVVRRGDGLAVIEPGDADVVTIAGMGGSLIASILAAGDGEGKLEGVRKLVLQPNVGEELVRRWIAQNGWFLEEERILEEDGKIYEILAAVRAEDPNELNRSLYGGEDDRDLRFKMGPYLLQRPDAVFIRKWESEIVKLTRIVEQMETSESTASVDKRKLFEDEIASIRQVLAREGRG